MPPKFVDKQTQTTKEIIKNVNNANKLVTTMNYNKICEIPNYAKIIEDHKRNHLEYYVVFIHY